MSQAYYQIILTGKPADGVAVAQARAALARLFKLSDRQVETLLSEAPVVIKKGLDELTAGKYQAALRKAGWLSEVRSPETTASTPIPATSAVASPPPATSVETPTPLQATIAPVGSLMAEPRQVPPLEVDLSGFTLAEPGAQIGESREVEPPRLDLSSLSLAEPGARLDQDPDTGEGTSAA